jgi:quercetin 2,3-dioxygenase
VEEQIFQRDIKETWKVKYTEKGFPHVQQAWVLPPERLKDFDPFILMAEDWFKRGTFSDHPHRGFQTITYVIDGRLEHIDNAGGHSILEAGDVQYMNAGWAARHAEEAVDNDLIHTLQLWLNLPKALKNTKTTYQDIYVENVPLITFEGGSIKVYSGNVEGIQGPLDSLVPITMVEISLAENGTYTHLIPENHNAFLYVLSGELEFGDSKTVIEKTGAATLTFNENGNDNIRSELKIKAYKRSKVLVYSGVPIKEEIVAYGPFVMNSMEEIQQAYQDFQAGKFGPLAK